MRHLSLLIVLSFLLFTAQAQYQYTVAKLEESKLPQAVKNNFSTLFKNPTVVRWELHTGKGSLKSKQKYVVIFDKDGIRSRARFQADGTGISASSYFLFNRLELLPKPVLKFVAEKYPDYKLGSGEKVVSLKNQSYVYKVRVRKGASLMVLFLNEKGEIIQLKDLADELKEDEGDGNT